MVSFNPAWASIPPPAILDHLLHRSHAITTREDGSRVREKTRMRLDVKNSDISGSVFDDVNMSGWTARNVNMSGPRIDNANLAGLHIADANLVGATISNCRFEGMTIDGISVEDALAAYRQSKAALKVG